MDWTSESFFNVALVHETAHPHKPLPQAPCVVLMQGAVLNNFYVNKA